MAIRISEHSTGIRVLAIDCPATRNAFDTETYRLLAEAITAADSDPVVSSVVITGHGGIFTSGNDIVDFREQKGLQSARSLLYALVNVDIPVIAAVEGFAIGIGTTLLLHCDLAYAGRSTSFSLPFVKLGLSAEGGSTLLLPKIAGDKRAAEMLLLGERFDATAAQSAGLINRVVDDGTALAVATDIARTLQRLPTEAVLDTKRLLRQNRRDVLTVIEKEAVVFRERASSPQARQAFDTFLQESGR